MSRIPSVCKRPEVAQLARGVALGTAAAALAASNACIGVQSAQEYAERVTKPATGARPDEKQLDLYAAAVALFSTQRIMLHTSLPPWTRVGATFPAAAAVGVSAAWALDRAGPTATAVLAFLRGFIP